MNTETFIKKIAKEAGEAVWERFGKDGLHYMKSEYSYDVVTKADLMADALIVSAIRKNFPHHGINAEESGKVNENAEYVWYVDPIDGTENFSKGIPFFGVMIALTRRKSVVVSAVYLPAAKELFFARSGGGAFLNGKRIHCSPLKDFLRSDGCCQLRLRGKSAAFLKKLLPLGKGGHLSVNSYNCFAVNGSYVAMGRKDWVVAPYGAPHDYAAPSLILKESGCTVTDLKGKPWQVGTEGIVAANPTLHKQLLKLTKNV